MRLQGPVKLCPGEGEDRPVLVTLCHDTDVNEVTTNTDRQGAGAALQRCVRLQLANNKSDD